MYNAGLVEKSKTFFGDRTVFFNKPLHIDRYNSLMGSVDMADQLLKPYAYEKKSLAWLKKLGIHFIFRILLNSFLVYRNQTKYKGDFLKYIISVSEELSCKHSDGARALHDEEKERKLQRPTKKMAKEELVHAWVRHQPRKQKMCRVCYKESGKRKDTVYYCLGCPGEPGLCSLEHFTSWHRDIPKPVSKYPAADIWVAFGSGKNFTYLHINIICHALAKEKSMALLVFHNFTGCDTTSTFFGKGKKTTWEAWRAYPEVTEAFNYLVAHPHTAVIVDSR
ncbi:PiggyBac transposable element-derived protein 4 [Chionoecetes opilio]|uniref:PiggyBac transposable element-derived protein 4 n=1 Tax=Chionoecetes opilio TaxID=41210 RepID=A0A8J5CFM8_CHIOP|nr:PiggyBac transposable element-derived protein 4 [Chionoecetes opilio]